MDKITNIMLTVKECRALMAELGDTRFAHDPKNLTSAERKIERETAVLIGEECEKIWAGGVQVDWNGD